jgi:hypothetical protein
LSWWVIEQSFDTHQLSLSGKTRANITHFGEIVAMAGRDIDANSVQDADVLIVRSRTKVNQALLQDSQVKALVCIFCQISSTITPPRAALMTMV